MTVTDDLVARRPAPDPVAPPVRPAAATGLDARLAMALAFGGSGCLLILEILASRLIAPTLGVSLYTWTSVIGVVLAGVTIGNYAGGRIADRWPSRSTVAIVYLAGSLASLAILGLVRTIDSLQLPGGTPTIVQVLWVTGLLFLVPSTVIAAATPVLTRLSLHAVEEGGRVVGRIQAAAALGSITGTFLTGFVLISAFGTRRIVAGVAVMLLLFAVASRPPWPARSAYGLGALLLVIVASGWASHSNCLRESGYYCIRVENVKVAAVTGGQAIQQADQFRALYLDRTQEAVSDINNPRLLFYPYEQVDAAAIRTLYPAGTPVDAFFLGGGGYTFPRWLEASYPGRSLVAEIDPAVTSVARSYLGLDRSPRIRTVNQDARRALEALPAADRFDVVFGDAFNNLEVPFQLTTKQFDGLVARHLKPGGLYLLNVIDAVHYDFLRSELRTLRLTFPYVAVLADPTAPWPPHGGNDVAVVASNRKPARPLSVVPQAQLTSFLASGHSVVLTDDHAPVEQLLAPAMSLSLHG